MFNRHSENIQKNVCNRMFSKHLIETFKHECFEKQLILNVCKTSSEQAFAKHCQQVVFKHFMCTIYQTFHDECLKNISSIFISSDI